MKVQQGVCKVWADGLHAHVPRWPFSDAAGIEGRSAPATGEGAAPATTGEETKR